MTFTIGELARFLKTTHTVIYRACGEAGVGVRWEKRRLSNGQTVAKPQPLTEEEARDVIRAFHSRKARARL